MQLKEVTEKILIGCGPPLAEDPLLRINVNAACRRLI
jgi:hypothetical protein